MIKNTASQRIGAQMCSATDGSNFTGAVTVYVTGDAGTQAAGSVGAGACTHEGQGYHTYAPAQAETNYDLIAFTFVGSGAVSATVQIFTRAGDSFTRLGAPAGASVSADIAAVKVDTAAILVDTGTTLDARIPAALVSGRMDVSVGAMAANVMTAAAAAADLTTELQSGVATAANLATVAGYLDTEIAAIITTLGTPAGVSVSADIAAMKVDTAAILVDTAEIGAAGAGLTAINLPNQTMDIVGNITGNLSGSVGSVSGAVGSVTGAVGSVTGLTASDVGAIKTKTDSLTFTVAGQVDANIQRINDVTITGNGGVGTEFGV